MPEIKTVLLVDNHEVILMGLRSLLANVEKLTVIAEVNTGEDAYELYSAQFPDIVILDISIPGMGGIETIRKIRARNKDPIIIVYTTHTETIHVRQALEAGAKAYLLKSEPIKEVMNAMAKALKGHHHLSPTIAQNLAMESVSGDSVPNVEKLSAREYEVFCFLANGMKVNEIARLLAISSKTVATYQTQLKQKLNISTSVDLVKAAMKAGVLS